MSQGRGGPVGGSASGKPAWRERARTALDESIARSGERPGLLRHGVYLLLVAVTSLAKSNITVAAAALAYRTIFGLVPVIIVALVVLRAFASPADVTGMVRRTLAFAGLNQIVVDDGASRAADFVGPLPMAAGAQRLDAWIEALVTRVMGIPFAAIGVIGVVILIYAAMSMVVEIEKTFNAICNAPSGRSWTRRVPLYWTLLTLGTLFLAGSFAASEAATAHLARLIEAGGLSATLGNVGQVLAYASALVISALMLVIMYATVPNTRLRIGPVIVGAVVAASLWELAKAGFTSYLAFSAKYSQLYGAVAILPLFLLWIYLTWVIILLGLQLAAAVQTYGSASARGLTHNLLASLGLVRARVGPRYVDPALILPVATGAAARFRDGLAVEAPGLARAVGIEEPVVAELLDCLRESGLLHRLEGTDRFAMARPADRITVGEVLRAGEALSAGALTGSGSAADAGGILARARQAQHHALGSMTLAELVGPGPVDATANSASAVGSAVGPQGSGGLASAG